MAGLTKVTNFVTRCGEGIPMPYSEATKRRKAASIRANWWPAEARREPIYTAYDEQEHARITALLARVEDLPLRLLIERATLAALAVVHARF